MPDNSKAEKISTEKARGGEVVLRNRKRRVIFLTGLIGLVVLSVILKIAGFY